MRYAWAAMTLNPFYELSIYLRRQHNSRAI